MPSRVHMFSADFVSRLVNQWRARRIVRRLVAEHRIDVVHQPIPVSPREPSLMYDLGAPVLIGPLNGGMSYPPAFRDRQAPHVTAFLRFGRWASGLIHHVIPGKRRAAILLVANERTRVALPSGLRGEVLTFLENGVDLSLWRPAEGARGEDGPCRIVFLGRLIDCKAVDLLLEAFRDVVARTPATLWIVGDGPQWRPWEEQARALGLDGAVEFLGWIPQEQCASLLRRADLLVLPSLHECGGAVVLEAMACALPVIATNWGGPADYLDDSCGILVDPDSGRSFVAGLAEAMVLLATSPDLRRALGRAGRERVVRDFDWDKKIEGFLDIYERLSRTAPEGRSPGPPSSACSAASSSPRRSRWRGRPACTPASPDRGLTEIGAPRSGSHRALQGDEVVLAEAMGECAIQRRTSDAEAAPVGPPESGGPLRVGLLVGSTAQPRWRRQVIADVAASADGELALVIRVRPSPEPEPGRAGRSPGGPRLLYRLYKGIDRLLFRRGPDALDEVDTADLIGDRPSVEVTLAAGDESFGEADVDRIRAHALDVVVCLGPEPTGSRVPRLARYGAWAYRFGEAGATDGEPSGVREVLGCRPATPASLNLLAAGPGGEERAVYQATLKTHRLSARRHGDHLGRVSSEFVGRALRRLGQEGSLALALAATPGGLAPRGRAGGLPRDGEMARLIARFGVRLAAEGLHRTLHRDQWILAYSTRGAWDGPRPDLSTLRRLVPPPDRFWADPFPVAFGGKRYLFFEEYPYAAGKGHISAIEIDERGRPGEPLTVLERDDHLSYPFVFPHGDELFMIPETTSRGAVELYRCVEFPGRWEFDRTLIAGVRAADATLAEHDGLWWMFACIPVEGAGTDTEELHLFHAESPLGPWRPHRHNPVKSDVGSARPAGRLYRIGEAWYRPAQDCTLGYGHSIVLNRVTRWDVEGYEEVVDGRIRPGWAPGVDRTHTFNALDSLFVVDARVARPRFFPGKSGS